MTTITKRLEKLESAILTPEGREWDYLETWTDEQIDHRIAELNYMLLPHEETAGLTQAQFVEKYMTMSKDERYRIEHVLIDEMRKSHGPQDIEAAERLARIIELLEERGR